MLIKKGSKKAKINLGGLTVGEIITVLKKKEKLKKQKVAEKNNYNTLESVYESEDSKSIILNFSEDKKLKFNLPDYKLYRASDNKPLNKEQINNVTFGKGIYKNPAYDLNCIIELSKTPWVKTFFNLLKAADLLTGEEVFFWKKDYYKVVEKLAKENFVQSLDKNQFEALKNILIEYEFKSSDFDLKEFRKNYYWYIENTNKICATGGCLTDYLETYHLAQKNNLKDVFEYCFNTYDICLSYDDDTNFFNQFIKLIKLGYEPFRLVDYIYRDLRNQGINIFDDFDDSIQLLFDYIKMNKDMKKDFEKYPRYLKTYHDITVKNYQIAKNASFKRRFNTQVKKFNKYEFSNDTYAVIPPKSVEDLVREGSTLCHCVASYADNIAEKETTIMFLRKKSSINVPLVTIEIKNNKVIQAKGKNNSSPQMEESKFLQEYKKHLLTL